MSREKLWDVTVKVRVFVVADDADEAGRLAVGEVVGRNSHDLSVTTKQSEVTSGDWPLRGRSRDELPVNRDGWYDEECMETVGQILDRTDRRRRGQ